MQQGSFALGLEDVYLSIEYIGFYKPLREVPPYLLIPKDLLAGYETYGLFKVY